MKPMGLSPIHCRWCDQPVVLFDGRRCHPVDQDGRLCPSPVPFEDHLSITAGSKGVKKGLPNE